MGYGFRASTISGVKGHGVFNGLIKSWCIKGCIKPKMDIDVTITKG